MATRGGAGARTETVKRTRSLAAEISSCTSPCGPNFALCRGALITVCSSGRSASDSGRRLLRTPPAERRDARRTKHLNGTFLDLISPTNAQAHAWMSQWRAAGPALTRVRAAELECVDLCRVADELEEALWARVRAEPVTPSSGLVAQQRIFARAPRR